MYQTPPARVSIPGLWLIVFSATLAAILVGGVLLGVGLRFYLHWSIKDTMQQMNDPTERTAQPEPATTKPANPFRPGR